MADDGAGMAADAPAGVGLLAVRERAAELGGAVAVESVPGGGTRVTVRIPVLPREVSIDAAAGADR